MGDIILDTPLEITPNATKVTNYTWSITPDSIIAQLNYYDVTGSNIVKQETFSITDADFTPMANSTVQQVHVGQKFMDIIEKAIRNKVKSMKGWEGTVP